MCAWWLIAHFDLLLSNYIDSPRSPSIHIQVVSTMEVPSLWGAYDLERV